MALATRCPNCSTIFRVGAEQLKSRAGMVRCGSCRHVFNAIGCLDYVDPAKAEADRPLAQKAGVEPAPSAAARTPIRPAMAPASQPVEDPRASRQAAASTPSDRQPPAATQTLEFAHARMERQLDAAEQSPNSAGSSAEGPITNSAPAAEAGPSFDQLFAVSEEVAVPAHEPGAGPPDRTHVPAAELEASFLRSDEEPTSRARRIALGVGCLLLAPILLVQLALLFRADVIVQLPQLRPALMALCKPLACTAQWPMQPEFLAVVSSELQAVPGTEALELSVVVRNRAGFPMALPSIELTLTDSLNHPVARKVFLPTDFVATQTEPAGAASEYIAAGADLSIRLLFELPGLNAAGFVAYPFYP